MEIKDLQQIAQAVGREDVLNELNIIQNRLDTSNKEIVMPLVGEFSSGKTSLINALLEGNKLETASKATTATIFEIYFGKESNYAEVVSGEQVESYENIADIKNDNVSEKDLIRVYDTSQKVPSSTILVDTPGLSSSDAKHKIALTSYLPKSDAIFLVTDINQQITRSLIDFVEDFKLSKKHIYLIINKCDTKTAAEVKDVKQYIADNIKISIDDMVCVSAITGDLGELHQLLDKIQKNKNEIVERALRDRIESIKNLLAKYIEDLLRSLSSDAQIDDLIYEQELHLKKINNNINELIQDADRRIETKTDECKRDFSNHVADKLDSIVASQGRDIDAAVYAAVNQTSQMMLNNYSADVVSILTDMARERQSKMNEVPLHGLQSIDTSRVALLSHSYDMELSRLGHEHDELIGGVALGAVAVATVALTSGVGVIGGVVKQGAKAVAGKAVADAVAKPVNNMMQLVANTNAKMQELKNNAQTRNIIETGVGWITDNFLGKPQRRRAVRNYVDERLIPEFVNHLRSNKQQILAGVSELLQGEAKNATQHMEKEIAELKTQQRENQQAYEQKVKEYKGYVQVLKK